MDIFNRIPSISEDTIQYTLYPPSQQCDKASATALATCIQLFVESQLPDFIWHREAFGLKVVSDPDGEGWILEGRMRVGDCVDDEWCVVWLLREISANWDLAISVFDSDGDFLLIEAAEVLPSWVKPSNSENRVWIHNSRLHLVPILHISPPSRQCRRRQFVHRKDAGEEEIENGLINAHDAIKLVRDETVNTLAPSNVEDTVWRRISGYPASTREHIHVTKAYLPIDIAKVLSVNPSLVQKPIETFYTRDAIQLRGSHRMARFTPEPSVLRAVKMTRTAYAQLTGQKFYPPKVFGRWQETEGTPQWRWRDVGMKIAIGFEMLFRESKGRASEFSTADTGKQKEMLRRDPEYAKYLENLTSVNYFKGEREGSQLWAAFEDKAAAMFIEVRREDEAMRHSFATLVTAALSQTANRSITSTTEEEYPDDWLEIDPENFDHTLEKTMGTSLSVSGDDAVNCNVADSEALEDHLTEDHAHKLQKLAGKVEEFVQGEGDLEGALFEDDDFSEEEDDENDSDDNANARQAAMDRLVPGLELSEYGKMPASFHRNSQKVASITMDTAVEGLPKIEKGEPRFKPIRKPILPRDDFDGVDSDDETDEESAGESDGSEDQPQLVGDIEIDMGEEEEEFLQFSRQMLGIGDDQWKDIVQERQKRGAFVPTTVERKREHSTQKPTLTERIAPSPGNESKLPTAAPVEPHPDADLKLDSFEAVMRAMDAELARSRKQKINNPESLKGKETVQKDAVDIEAAMDAELKASLESEASDDEDGEGEETVDYNLIKNFLESFKSQGGLPGPVSNLAGRLQPGWTLPRDGN